jgi:hypothetical protein
MQPSAARWTSSARHSGLLIGAAAAFVLLVGGIWYVTRPSPSGAVSATGRGSTAKARPANETEPTATTLEQKPQSLNERCFEWLGNWSNALNGTRPTWQSTQQSAVEQGDRDLLQKYAAHMARMSAENRAMRDATSGQASTDPMPPKIDWTAQDSANLVMIRDKIAEWGYAILCENKEPAMAARETATRIGAGRIEDILKAKHAGDKKP